MDRLAGQNLRGKWALIPTHVVEQHGSHAQTRRCKSEVGPLLSAEFLAHPLSHDVLVPDAF